MEESKTTQKLLDSAKNSAEKPNIAAPPASSSIDVDSIQEPNAKASVSAVENKTEKPVDLKREGITRAKSENLPEVCLSDCSSR